MNYNVSDENLNEMAMAASKIGLQSVIDSNFEKKDFSKITSEEAAVLLYEGFLLAKEKIQKRIMLYTESQSRRYSEDPKSK